MPGKEVIILRVGHRPERDQRVTTHVGLTARALGAKGMYLAAADKGVVQSIRDVVSRWGGDFFCQDTVAMLAWYLAIQRSVDGVCRSDHQPCTTFPLCYR